MIFPCFQTVQISAWFQNRWKSQMRPSGAPSSFEPVTDATTWTFNEVSRSIRVPVQSLRAADVGPTASTLQELNKETLYHGTRAGVLCLILRDLSAALVVADGECCGVGLADFFSAHVSKTSKFKIAPALWCIQEGPNKDGTFEHDFSLFGLVKWWPLPCGTLSVGEIFVTSGTHEFFQVGFVYLWNENHREIYCFGVLVCSNHQRSEKNFKQFQDDEVV